MTCWILTQSCSRTFLGRAELYIQSLGYQLSRTTPNVLYHHIWPSSKCKAILLIFPVCLCRSLRLESICLHNYIQLYSCNDDIGETIMGLKTHSRLYVSETKAGQAFSPVDLERQAPYRAYTRLMASCLPQHMVSAHLRSQ